jgi:hypothetical protein
MQKEINFYQEMASEHRLQEHCKGTVPLYVKFIFFVKKMISLMHFLSQIPKLDVSQEVKAF